ncbi:MAG: tetratricopeptide repeat protein, partial [Terriglobales bacterium]
AQNDPPTVEQELAAAKAIGSEGEIVASAFQGNLDAYAGRMRQARELFSQVKEASLGAHLPESAASFLAGQAGWEAAYEQRQLAIEHAMAALQLSSTRNIALDSALALAVAGQERKALDAVSPFLKQRPDDTRLHQLWFPALQAIAELTHGNAAKAVEILKPASAYDGGSAPVHYLRATAYLHSGHPAEAAQEYQKVLSLKLAHDFGPDPLLILSQLGLARAYVAQGDKAKARTAYQDLLAVWKDADPDLPLVQTTRAEYTKLQ